jgi:outer membrane protein
MRTNGQRFAMRVWAVGLLLPACGLAAGENGEPGAVEVEKARIYVGGGAVVSSKPYIGVDAKVYPIPVFGYEGDRLYLRGITGGYRLAKSERFSFGPILRPRFEGYEKDDSPALDGMGNRRPTLDAGLEVSYRANWGLLSAAAVTDVLGEYDGQELEFAYAARYEWLDREIRNSPIVDDHASLSALLSLAYSF